MHFVYIIQSESSGILYKGYTTDPERRLARHNNGQSRFTAGKGPWKLVFLQEFEIKKEALIREKQLKHSNADYLRWVILQQYNRVR
jgi:putative endonuclease